MAAEAAIHASLLARDETCVGNWSDFRNSLACPGKGISEPKSGKVKRPLGVKREPDEWIAAPDKWLLGIFNAGSEKSDKLRK